MPCYVTNNMTIGRKKQYKSQWNSNSKLTQSSRCRVCILSNERVVNTIFHSVFFPPLDCGVLPKTINTTRPIDPTEYFDANFESTLLFK